jgi:hypothetical protein
MARFRWSKGMQGTPGEGIKRSAADGAALRSPHAKKLVSSNDEQCRRYRPVPTLSRAAKKSSSEFHRAGCAHDAATGRLLCPQQAMRYLDLAAPDAKARP